MPGYRVTRSRAGIEEDPDPRTTAVRHFLHQAYSSRLLTP